MQLKRMLVTAARQEEASPEFSKIPHEETLRAKCKRLLEKWSNKPHTQDLIVDFEPSSFVLGQKRFIITENKKYPRISKISDDGAKTVSNLKLFPSRKLKFFPQDFEEGQELAATKYLLDFDMKDFSKLLTERKQDLKIFNNVKCRKPVYF